MISTNIYEILTFCNMNIGMAVWSAQFYTQANNKPAKTTRGQHCEIQFALVRKVHGFIKVQYQQGAIMTVCLWMVVASYEHLATSTVKPN